MDEYYSERDGFLVVPTDSLLENEIAEFNVFLRVNGNYVFYRSKDIPFGSREKFKLIKAKVDVVYVDVNDKEKYQQYIERNLGTILSNQNTSLEKRGKILYSYSTHLIQEVFDEKKIGEGIKKSKELVKHTVNYLTSEEDAFRNFLNLVSYDYYTYTHCVNVCLFSIGLAQKVGVNSKEELNDLGTGAILHDIGKSRIDKGILNKNGPLSEEEWEIIKKHPLWGEEICKEMGVIPKDSYYPIVQHHEKCNGKGYPNGLKQDEIHPYAKIVCVADVFDALTTNRSYAGAEEPFPAIKIMLEEMEGNFDMKILKEFIVFLGSNR
jgi:putative nucleotidyltransferase with HDIG domain